MKSPFNIQVEKDEQQDHGDGSHIVAWIKEGKPSSTSWSLLKSIRIISMTTCNNFTHDEGLIDACKMITS
jgi:hypothetical protein